MKHKIAIVGTGAMGSLYAALFAEAGHETWAIDVWQEHIQEINTHGLRVEGASGGRWVKGIRATNSVFDADICDVYIIATKGSGVAKAARDISSIIPDHALMLTIQNGLGAGERVAEYMSTKNVLLGVADGFGASIKTPGHVHHNAMKLIRLGEMMGGITQRLKEMEDLWQGAGFNAHAFKDINQHIWEKFICNVTLSAPCTVFDCTVGELMKNCDWREIALGCMLEAYKCGLAEEINFSFENIFSGTGYINPQGSWLKG